MPFWTAWGPLSTFRATFAKGPMCSSGWSTPGPPLAAGTPRPFLLPPGHSGLARTATKPILVKLSDPIQLLQTCQTGEGRVHFRGFLSNPLERSNVLRSLTKLYRQNFFAASPQPVPAPACIVPAKLSLVSGKSQIYRHKHLHFWKTCSLYLMTKSKL